MFTVANLERAEPHEVWFPQLRTHEHPVLWWLILFERTSWHWHSENQRNHKDTPHQFVTVSLLPITCFSYPPVTILFPVSCFLLTYPHFLGGFQYTQIIRPSLVDPGCPKHSLPNAHAQGCWDPAKKHVAASRNTGPRHQEWGKHMKNN